MGFMDWLKGLGGKKESSGSDKVVVNHEEQVAASTPTPAPTEPPAPSQVPAPPDPGVASSPAPGAAPAEEGSSADKI